MSRSAPRLISAIPTVATGRKPTRSTIAWPEIDPIAAPIGKTIEVSPNFTGE